MINGLKPYPAYKDSGVPWLGKVPEHWEVKRAKTFFKSRKQLNIDGSETNVLSLTLRGVVNNNPDKPEGLVPKDYKTYQIFEKDDLVFKLIDLENLRTSRVGLVHERGIMSPAYVRLTLYGQGDVRFYYQQFYDLYQRHIYNQIGEGVRSTIGWADLANLFILSPPLPEQTAIVRFLDYMDRRIRRYIRSKQKIIKLLEEYKQALIHQAVTGQIDVRTGKPYPAYKDSGVPWLGKVPEHWEVRRLKNICRFVYGDALPNASRKDGSVPVYGSNGRVGFHSVPNAQAPCIVIGRKGSFGKVQYSDAPIFAIDTTFFVDGRFTSAHLRWLFFALGWLRLDEVSKDSAVPGLDRQDAYKRFLVVPPLPEQTAIVAYLDAQTARIDAAISATWREIELLREYRERLIADVVTGKVDVREVAGQLPEEPPEEPELIEEEIIEDDATDQDTDREGFVEEENES